MRQSGLVPLSNTSGLRAAFDDLADAVAALRFDLASPGRADDRELRDRVTQIIRHHLRPRLLGPDAPVAVAVAGPTGSGKSTVVNSLAGRVVSPAGVLRPTTGRPVVWRHHHSLGPPDLDDLEIDVQLDDHPLLRGVTIIDTPDLDSQVRSHRRIAEAVLDRVDLVVFVTTPHRYADAESWSVLDTLSGRGTPVIVVLNRATRRTQGARTDLGRLLDRAGIDPLGGVVEIQEHRIGSGDGLLARGFVRRLVSILEEVAVARGEFVERGIEAASSQVVAGTHRLLTALERQRAAVEELVSIAAKVHDSHLEELATSLEHGEILRSDVVERWLRSGSGGPLPGPGFRARVGRSRVAEELRDELAREVTARLDAARRATEAAWALHPSGSGLAPLARTTLDEVRRTLADWDVRSVGRGRGHRSPRRPSAGVLVGGPERTTPDGDQARLLEVIAGLFDRQRDTAAAVVLARRDPVQRIVELRHAISAVEARLDDDSR